LGILIVLVIVGTLVVNKANASKPGDSMFSLEKSIEQIQRGLAFSQDSKISLELDFLRERIEELRELSTDNIESSNVEIALNELNEQENKAEQEYQKDKGPEGRSQDIEKKYSEYRAEIENYLNELKGRLAQSQIERNTNKINKLQQQISNMEQILQNPGLVRDGSGSEGGGSQGGSDSGEGTGGSTGNGVDGNGNTLDGNGSGEGGVGNEGKDGVNTSPSVTQEQEQEQPTQELEVPTNIKQGPHGQD
jgi:hypothetical protein